MTVRDWVEEWQMDPYIVHWWSLCPDMISNPLGWWTGHGDGMDVDWEMLPSTIMVICYG